MVNVVQSRTLVGGGASKVLVLHIHITSDGTEETNLVVYDNSAFVNNVLKGNLVDILVAGGQTSPIQLTFAWDQTTDSKVIALNPVNTPHKCFKYFGGIGNPGAAGATGDLLLSTVGLTAGDEITIILEIWQN